MKHLNVKEQLQGLISQAPATPVQKVNPVKTERAYHLNCWLDGEQEKALKQYALDHDLSIKETVLTALELLYSQSTK
ncbi:hypothetical protein [Fibrella forsythiae]|uniref:CopG family transcriptional regulator n=1 Tax=Fibrella forsythiae TaxID=2817061 RepID=A0ABS3JSI2_9BACT|nr:hypothetical protein [Fibrella forsythiae]MBO0952977.1 hypothetical protein [Fibrella forsythiae]